MQGYPQATPMQRAASLQQAAQTAVHKTLLATEGASPIKSALDGLNEASDALGRTIDLLAERLTPVLAPASAPAIPDGTNEPVATAPLVRGIEEQTRRLRRLRAQLEGLESLLAL